MFEISVWIIYYAQMTFIDNTEDQGDKQGIYTVANKNNLTINKFTGVEMNGRILAENVPFIEPLWKTVKMNTNTHSLIRPLTLTSTTHAHTRTRTLMRSDKLKQIMKLINYLGNGSQ